jgi:sarcosine oxidase, subunit gamma
MPERAAIRITPLEREVVHLKGWGAEPGLPLFSPSKLDPSARLLKLGPDEWIVVSEALKPADLFERVKSELPNAAVAIVDLSCALKVLRLEGVAARDLLSGGCGLDLHSQSFPAGHSSRTRLAQLAVIIDCSSDDRFDLYVGRSYRAYLESWLRDAQSLL